MTEKEQQEATLRMQNAALATAAMYDELRKAAPELAHTRFVIVVFEVTGEEVKPAEGDEGIIGVAIGCLSDVEPDIQREVLGMCLERMGDTRPIAKPTSRPGPSA